MVAGTQIVASKQNSEDENDYTVTYDISLKATNKTDQTLKYYLVKVDGTFEREISGVDCTLTTSTSSTETRYYYEGCTVEGSGKIISSNFGDSELIAYGEIAANADNQPISFSGSEETDLNESYSSKKTPKGLTGHTLKTKGTAEATTAKYYLIVEFPNTGSSQNGLDNVNFGKEISVTFDAITNVSAEIDNAG